MMSPTPDDWRREYQRVCRLTPCSELHRMIEEAERRGYHGRALRLRRELERRRLQADPFRWRREVGHD